MIQRIQTLWLFLAALCGALSFKFSFYSGNKTSADGKEIFEKCTASSDFILLILTIILTAECLALIFMYKNRKQQLWLSVTALIISLINLVIYFAQVKKFTGGTFSLSAILVFAIPVFLALAARGIWKDEKLVRSVDRIR